MKIDALLWDYDGTLVNSVPKNIDITKQILQIVAPRLTGDNLPYYLQSEKNYQVANYKSQNWQDLYVNYYGMTENEMKEAGKLWTVFQLKNETAVNFFPHVVETIHQISLPQGICSQNSSANIAEVLAAHGIHHKFNAIVGYEDVPYNSQKPHPFSGLKCLMEMFSDLTGKTVIYIGDHESDVIFARNLQKEVGEKCKIVSVAVKYSGTDMSTWKNVADLQIEKPNELIEIIKSYQ